MSQRFLFVPCDTSVVHRLLKTQALFAILLAHSLYTGAIEVVVFNSDNRVTVQKRHTQCERIMICIQNSNCFNCATSFSQK